VKRRKLLRYLHRHGCFVIEDRGPHTKVLNSANGKTTSVPRHVEVDGFLTKVICKQLGIPPPSER